MSIGNSRFILLIFYGIIGYLIYLSIFNLVIERDPTVLLILGGIAVLVFLAIFFATDVKLKFTPKPLRTAKMCLAAVNKNWKALEYVPKSLCARNFA